MAPSTRQSRVAAVLTGLLPLAMFWRVFAGEGLLLFRDVTRISLPAKLFWRNEVFAGRFPSWFPYDGLGFSFVQTVVSGPFDPLNLLFLVLPPTLAMQVIILGCYPAAALAVFALCRRYGAAPGVAAFGGLVYALSGYLVGISVNLPYIESSALLPVALLCADRYTEKPSPPRLLFAVLTQCWILFVGDPQAFLFSMVIAGGLIALRRRDTSVLLFGGLTLLFTAPQWIPSVLLLKEATPAGLRGHSSAWSAHPLQLVDFLVGPLFDSSPSDARWANVHASILRVGMDEGWVSGFFMGPLPLVLAAAGFAHWRRNRLAQWGLGLTIFFLVLALGRFAYVYPWLHRLPLFSSFRYPVKLIPFAALGLALAAAAGLQVFHRRSAVALAVIGLALVAIGGTGIWQGLLESAAATGTPSALVNLATTRFTLATRVVGIATCVAGLALFFTPARFRAWSAIALAVPLLFWTNGRTYPLVPSSVVEQPSAFLQEVLRDGEGSGPARTRVFAGSKLVRFSARTPYSQGITVGNFMGFLPSTTALFDVPTASNYWPGTFKRSAELIQRMTEGSTLALRLGSVRYLSLYGGAAAPEGFRQIADHPGSGLQLHLLPNPAPRLFFGRPRCVADAQAAWRMLDTGTLDGLRDVAVECEGTPPFGEGAAEPEAWVPGAVDVVLQGQGGVIVLGESFSRGWSVEIDGEPGQVRPANTAFVSALVPAGAHRVSFRYHTPGLALGWALFALGCVLWLSVSRSQS